MEHAQSTTKIHIYIHTYIHYICPSLSLKRKTSAISKLHNHLATQLVFHKTLVYNNATVRISNLAPYLVFTQK